MGRFILKRIGQGLIVIFLVTFVVFVITRMVGDPIDFILPLEATEQERDARSAELGFDRSVPEQYFDYMGHLVSGDFDESLSQRGVSTMDIVRRTLPKTLQLVVVGLGLALVLALIWGVTAALRPGSWVDRLMVTTSMLGLSVPQFWLGLILIVVFGVQLQWLPTSGSGSWQHIVLPAVTLALPAAGRLAMVIRSAMIDELNSQYVKTARAKGIARHRIVGMHALKNASIPIITLFGWEVIRAVAGYTVVVETVFDWPGMGATALEAIKLRDLFLIQTIVLVVAVMVVIINIIIDIAYKAVDPRIEVG